MKKDNFENLFSEIRTGGTYDTADQIIPPIYYDKQGYFFREASEIKKTVNVLVMRAQGNRCHKRRFFDRCQYLRFSTIFTVNFGLK
jgi:hypothetical protein